jgi:hypothetical protein
MLLCSTVKPLRVSLVEPVAYLKDSYGLGLTLVILMGVLVSIDTESRHNIPGYIIAVPFLGVVVDKLPSPSRFIWLIGILALAASKIWMRMGLPAYDDEQYLRFPLQNAFMSIGPWMNDRMFVLQGSIVLATAALLYAYLRSKRQRVA